MKILATSSGLAPGVWKLCHDASRDQDGWYRIELVRPPEARKPRTGRARRPMALHRSYTLAWNGYRLAHNSAVDQLREHFPGMTRWVEQTLPLITHWEAIE